jgi:hypothetical protein
MLSPHSTRSSPDALIIDAINHHNQHITEALAVFLGGLHFSNRVTHAVHHTA